MENMKFLCQGFSYWGWGGEESPSPAKNLLIPPPLKKIPPIRHPPPKVNPLPPLNNNFQVMTQQKQHF